MRLKQFPSIHIPQFHLIGGTLLLLIAISISFFIDAHYEFQNRKAYAMALRADQSIQEYYEHLNYRKEALSHQVQRGKLSPIRYTSLMKFVEEVITLNEIYQSAAEALSPIGGKFINQKVGNRLEFKTLNQEHKKVFLASYKIVQGPILDQKNTDHDYYKDHNWTSKLEARKAFRKGIGKFSFETLKNLSRAQAYWRIKQQQLVLIKQMKVIEQEYPLSNLSNPYQYHIQPKTTKTRIALGEAITLEAELLRSIPINKKNIKVLSPGYRLVHHHGVLCLEKKVQGHAKQKENVQLEITNPYSGLKEIKTIEIQYYIHS